MKNLAVSSISERLIVYNKEVKWIQKTCCKQADQMSSVVVWTLESVLDFPWPCYF